jgi:hypothetical protein
MANQSIWSPPQTLGAQFSIQTTTHPPWVRLDASKMSGAVTHRVVDRQPAIAAVLRRDVLKGTRR